MRFLVDECTGPNAADWLLLQGHEVFSAHKQSRGASDEFLIRKAFAENWILITNDKDFGEKVYRERLPHRGVIFLRLEKRHFRSYSSGRRPVSVCACRPAVHGATVHAAMEGRLGAPGGGVLRRVVWLLREQKNA